MKIFWKILLKLTLLSGADLDLKFSAGQHFISKFLHFLARGVQSLIDLDQCLVQLHQRVECAHLELLLLDLSNMVK